MSPRRRSMGCCRREAEEARWHGPWLRSFALPGDGGLEDVQGRLSVPQHNEVAGCCFKCVVTPAGIRDTTSAAPWRTERLGHWDLIARMRSQGITPTPVFNAPGVRSSIFRLDWLHVADLGVSADWLGGLFTYIAEHKFPGRSFAAKLSGL